VAANGSRVQQGRYRVKGTISRSASRSSAKKSRRPRLGAATFPCAILSERGPRGRKVEIDPERGGPDPALHAVDDCGGSSITCCWTANCGRHRQGIGQVMGEHAIYDETSGQLLTGTFMDYEMPRADACPRAAARSLDPSPGNPLGVKGRGGGTTGRGAGERANAVDRRRCACSASIPSISYTHGSHLAARRAAKGKTTLSSQAAPRLHGLAQTKESPSARGLRFPKVAGSRGGPQVVAARSALFA